MDIHVYAKRGDLTEVQRILGSAECREKLINAFDEAGMTPLMHAVSSPDARVEIVSFLLEGGAEVNIVGRTQFDSGRSALSFALGAGDPEKVALLLDSGADLHYKRDGGYDAVIDAVHGRDITRDAGLMGLLRLLVERGARVDGCTKYCESGVRVASNLGRFDAVKLLLDAGADAKKLGWTPLMHTIAFGTLAEVKGSLGASESLKARDSWTRTPWLLAIQTGSIAKAQLLLDRGADIDVRGHFGKPPLFYAIGNGHVDILRWLLSLGMDPEQTDGSGITALMAAAEYGDVACVELLLAHGADVDAIKAERSPAVDAKIQQSLRTMGVNPEKLPELKQSDETALSYASSRQVALRLLATGADPAKLGRETRRLLIGFAEEPTDEYRLVSPDDFLHGRHRRFGRGNPEEIYEPFWEAMVRSGINAWQASLDFKNSLPELQEPVWCSDRFGQSITFLPDGGIVEIAGEHEDSYDPDFCIYNDVIMHDGNGGIRIFAYPEEVFPPTDFHTATLVEHYIYIIGSLGYSGTRRFGETPVYRLDLNDFHMEALGTTGEKPGWIHRHRARLVSSSEIHVSGGELSVLQEGREQHVPNRAEYVLDLGYLIWSAIGDQKK